MDMTDMMAALKIAVGVQDDTRDALLQLLLDRTVDKVLAETYQPYLPTLCVSLAVEMAEDAYNLLMESRNENSGQIVGNVSGVSDNGQSVSYRGSEYATVVRAVSDAYLKDYTTRLAPFRKAGW